VRTLGIDIASERSRSGLVWLRWDPEPRVERVQVGSQTLDAVAQEMGGVLADGEPGWVAIDAPFGFPSAFTAAVSELHRDGRVSASGELTWRRTEEIVRARQQEVGFNRAPLSTVSQMITGTVVRCAELLGRVQPDGPIDKIGLTGRVVETYPIACLRVWGLLNPAALDGVPADVQPADYKKAKAAKATREANCGALFDRMTELVPSIGDLEGPDRRVLRTSDDAIDALVCALVAGVVARTPVGTSTTAPPPEDLELAEAEGWIHLPSVKQLRTAVLRRSEHA
jgi:hypothetical protein